MAIIRRALAEEPALSNVSDFLMVINGEIVTMLSVPVYMERSKDNVKFYYLTLNSYTQKYDKNVVNSSYIDSYITGNDFCGIHLDRVPQCKMEDLTIYKLMDMKILFIESNLYSEVRKAASLSSDKDITFQFGEYSYDSVLSRRIIQAFRDRSWINYFKLVYSSKFINRIYRTYGLSFYSTLRAFIPVLIECKYMFNPLTEIPGASIKDQRFFKEVERPDRKFSIIGNNDLTVQMATHLEVCKALHMKYFMVFTPQLLYQMIAGFLSGNQEFPNVRYSVWVTNEAPEGLKKKYTDQGFIALRLKLTDQAREDPKARQLLDELSVYTKRDTLYQYLITNRNSILNFGLAQACNVDGVNVDKMYECLAAAEII